MQRSSTTRPSTTRRTGARPVVRVPIERGALSALLGLTALVVLATGCGGGSPQEGSSPGGDDATAAAAGSGPAATRPPEGGQTAPSSGTDVGQRAPEFTLADLDGESWSLRDHRGDPAVIVFFRGAW